jgi:50S ribosomal protein L16 3-hydroxylase
MADTLPPLGGLSPKAFLSGYWQKRPLLIRQAIPGFGGLIGKRELFALAGNDQSESRLVEKTRGWRVTPGPFGAGELSRLPKKNWTLLLNGLNLHCDAADSLLTRFAFASYARLDDVMVSYAVEGGGVGPHVDSYDVFLLQGPGRRRWRLMPPGKSPFKLMDDAPLKLISDFRPEQDMILEPGDMLYLPPGWGHEGTALDPCHTYSIGFRAPDARELSTAFLDYLHERGFADGDYADPDREPAMHPARIDSHLVRHAETILRRIAWNTKDVADFLGRYLSEPKQEVVFEPPLRPMARAEFLRRLGKGKVRLHARTRMLTQGLRLYINGSAFKMDRRGFAALEALADRRVVPGAALVRAQVQDAVYDWYQLGFLEIGSMK